MKKYLLAIVLVFVGVYLLDGHCNTSREPRKVSSYWGVGFFKKYIKKRKIDMDELVISPKDIYDA